MGNTTTVTTRTFTVKEGMTPEDVLKSPNATAQQKKMAHVFDADGVKGYSKREADVFNATAIADHGKNGVSLWTQYADGSRKETTVKGDLKAFKYAPQGEVKSISYKTGKPQKRKVEKKQPDEKRGTLFVPANYKNPYIGADGIKADTVSRYKLNNAPATIYYVNKKDILRREDFDEKGRLTTYTDLGDKNKDGWYEYDQYDAFGKHIAAARLEGEHDRRIYYKDVKPGYLEQAVENTKTRNTVYEKYRESDDGTTDEYFYYSDGTQAKDVHSTSYFKKIGDNYDTRYGKHIVEYNRQGKKIKETESGWYNTNKDGRTTITKYSGDIEIQIDVLDDNDVLKYSIYPKYNNDGILVKNDTIWNKQK